MRKICSSCGIEKDESEFNKNRHAKDGLYSYCKTCSNEKSKNGIMTIGFTQKKYLNYINKIIKMNELNID